MPRLSAAIKKSVLSVSLSKQATMTERMLAYSRLCGLVVKLLGPEAGLTNKGLTDNLLLALDLVVDSACVMLSMSPVAINSL
jgi:hypothetical protein